jgi:hypothetical protein
MYNKSVSLARSLALLISLSPSRPLNLSPCILYLSISLCISNSHNHVYTEVKILYNTVRGTADVDGDDKEGAGSGAGSAADSAVCIGGGIRSEGGQERRRSKPHN